MPSPYLRTPFFHERAPPPGVDLSLQERLEELYPKNPLRGDRVNIGFAAETNSRASRGRVSDWRRGARANKELEKAAREGSLDIDLAQVRDSWVQSGAVYDDILAAGDMYGVFEDLFGHAYFRPCLMLDIKYEWRDVLVPVHRGNMVKPREAAAAPRVSWQSESDHLWCLMMTGLDSHLQSETCQYLHWMVANIRGSDLASGDTICDYIQPFPAFGTGYHRYSFVLFKQEERMELDRVDESNGEIDLQARSINLSTNSRTGMSVPGCYPLVKAHRATDSTNFLTDAATPRTSSERCWRRSCATRTPSSVTRRSTSSTPGYTWRSLRSSSPPRQERRDSTLSRVTRSPNGGATQFRNRD